MNPNGDVVVKPSGSGNGKGIVFVKGTDSPEMIREKIENAAASIEKDYGKGAGFPWAAVPRVNLKVVDNHEQELRVVSFIVDGHALYGKDAEAERYVVAVPTIFKKSPTGEADMVMNVTANLNKLTDADKADPDFMTRLQDAACNKESLEKHGLNVEGMTDVCRWSAAFTRHVVSERIKEKSAAAQASASQPASQEGIQQAATSVKGKEIAEYA
ncbi:MAG TPA: hypothetical protein VGU61_22395 [Noviherbaspirillum sp.]|jgi:hypothetical protein|uniref:hypothetical protein n=1 Tax=Noviherbaspirillum sp. TaxID=1926288 RepID=UPI002DDCA8F9|nr:hypothetical protein [Noviherbaspirillum sp.]HEV2613027.1 hypothetical protein [Noviherbaspirillum sp.]